MGAKTPVTDRAWAIGNLRKFGAPSTKFPQIANLQWSVCLHVAHPGIHPQGAPALRVPLLSRCPCFQGSPLLSGAKCGVCAEWGQNPPFDPPLTHLLRRAVQTWTLSTRLASPKSPGLAITWSWIILHPKFDRQSMGDWQFEEIWRPKRQISSNC